jgi:ubiquinone/menaquinone biosynthesis C-methylase UbiE
MPNYGDAKYWEDRYKNDKFTTFDWLENYPTLKEIIDSLNISKESGKILNLGCGNSEFSENMYDDGYTNIKNIDISQSVINQMSERCKNRTKMTYEVMDVRDIKYDNNYFDLAIDKSTIDALLCGDDAFINVAKMIKEVQRVLKVGGYYMIISYGTPDNRVLHLNRKFEKFNIEIIKIEKDYIEEEGYDSYHYIYLCKKLEGADEISNKYFDETIKSLIEQQKREDEGEEEELDESENKSKDEINITDKIENINCTTIKKQNDTKEIALVTTKKVDVNKNEKKENIINGKNKKITSDLM